MIKDDDCPVCGQWDHECTCHRDADEGVPQCICEKCGPEYEAEMRAAYAEFRGMTRITQEHVDAYADDPAKAEATRRLLGKWV